MNKTFPTCTRCVTRPCICWKLTQEKIEAERIALEGMTLLERYRNGKARFAIWLVTPIIINVNKWVFISIMLVALIPLSFILLSFIFSNLLECKVI